MKKCLKIGHRGASGHLPENTISSFNKALKLGAEAIELDVHLCKSGEPVVIHDDTVDRTTNGKGLVAELTLAQLKALTISGDEHIPTLQEALETIGSNIIYFIEVKHADAALPVAKLIAEYINKGWKAENLYLISFDHEALKTVHREFPDVFIGASFKRLFDNSVLEAKIWGARAIVPNYKLLTSEFINKAVKLDLKIFTWTVNDPEDIARLHSMGIDGIISDYPDRLSKL